MKKIALAFVLIATISCEENKEDDCADVAVAESSYFIDPLIYSEYTPIELSKDKLSELIEFTAPFDVEKAGKIYIKDDLIFIGEQGKGYHIYDNSSPENPIQKKFLKIGGTTDLAIREDYFYMNQFNDLITLKVDLANFTFNETGREKGVFSLFSPSENTSPDGYYFDSSQDKVIVGFSKKENFTAPEFPEFTQNSCFENVLAVDESASPTDGQGGSFATFSLKNNYLYTVDSRKLSTFLINEGHIGNPSFTGTIDVGFGIETLFNFADNLFIGSNNALYIYGLENPETPTFKSISQHFRACDPVVANETNAFVTIRGGSGCGGNSNQLKIYDILDVESPKLLLDRELVNPKGLALFGKYVFVADSAIRIFDVSDLENGNITLVSKIDQEVTDLIIRDNHLFAIGDLGIYQYKLDNTAELKIETLSELLF